MRSFHTKNSGEDSMHPVPVKIGRSMSDASGSPLSQSFSPPGSHQTSEKAFFSQSSTSQRMQENLSCGQEYLRLQGSGLMEMEKTLLLLSRENKKSGLFKNTSTGPGPDNRRIYLQSIETISSQTYTNFRLFGDGSESPLRIHLRNRGREFSHSIPIVPLFSEPSFLGILYSGRSRIAPSEDLIHDCITSLLQFCLQVESEKTKVSNLQQSFSSHREIKEYLSPSSAQRSERSSSARHRPPPKTMGFIRTWLRSLLLPQTSMQRT